MSLAFKEISVNDKPAKPDSLTKVQEMDQGLVKLTVQSPSVLLASEPAPITDRVVEWLMVGHPQEFETYSSFIWMSVVPTHAFSLRWSLGTRAALSCLSFR